MFVRTESASNHRTLNTLSISIEPKCDAQISDFENVIHQDQIVGFDIRVN